MLLQVQTMHGLEHNRRQHLQISNHTCAQNCFHCLGSLCIDNICVDPYALQERLGQDWITQKIGWISIATTKAEQVRNPGFFNRDENSNNNDDNHHSHDNLHMHNRQEY